MGTHKVSGILEKSSVRAQCLGKAPQSLSVHIFPFFEETEVISSPPHPWSSLG